MISFKKIFYLLLLISSSVFAQEGIVTGVVKDGSFNDVIPFANVVVKDTKVSSVTDIDGKYQIKLKPGKYTFVFSFIGYNTLTISDVELKSSTLYFQCPELFSDIFTYLNDKQYPILVELVDKKDDFISFIFDLEIKNLKDFTNLISEIKQQGINFKIIRNRKVDADRKKN